jgi:hypothetical protein
MLPRSCHQALLVLELVLELVLVLELALLLQQSHVQLHHRTGSRIWQ